MSVKIHRDTVARSEAYIEAIALHLTKGQGLPTRLVRNAGDKQGGPLSRKEDKYPAHAACNVSTRGFAGTCVIKTSLDRIPEIRPFPSHSPQFTPAFTRESEACAAGEIRDIIM